MSSSLRAAFDRVREALPEGLALPEEAWRRRHRMILLLVGVQAGGVLAFAVARGSGVPHGLFEASPIAASAMIAWGSRFGRTVRSVVATFGLITSSAIFVHLSGGTIEAHFHFFVMLAVISLYQSWASFLFAILYVVLHHGLVGVLDPDAVYNHPAAWANPWKWAGIHGAFVLAASIAHLVTWRFSEAARSDAQLLLESAGEGIFGIDQDGRITFMNASAARLLELDAASATGRVCSDVFRIRGHGEILEPGCSPMTGTLEDGRPRTSDAYEFERAGEFFAVQLTCMPVRKRDRTVGAVVTFQDRSDIHRKEEELRNALSLLTATLESTADGILVVDGQGRITSFNHQFAEMWRIPADIIEPRDDDRALAWVLDQLVDPAGFLTKVRELYANPEAESFDELRFKDARVFERFSKPQYVHGRAAGRVWSFRDVSERRRLDEIKNSFLSAVSHELRTPLTSVIGYAATLRRGDEVFESSDRLEIIDRLQANARKLERLVGEILDLDRLTRGLIEPRRSEVDVAELVRRVLGESEILGARPIHVHGSDVYAFVDAPKVERIVENLLMNAVRYTSEDAPVSISVRSEAGGARITVEDRGPGVPDELKEVIFEPFRQGPVVATHAPGVGIGLTLVGRFAELHGGRAWVEDRPGGGSAFHVYLPDAISRDGDAEVQGEPAA